MPEFCGRILTNNQAQIGAPLQPTKKNPKIFCARLFFLLSSSYKLNNAKKKTFKFLPYAGPRCALRLRPRLLVNEGQKRRIKRTILGAVLPGECQMGRIAMIERTCRT